MMKTIGVVGAGVMGVGTAQLLAESNIRVVLLDVDQSILERAKESIHRNIRLSSLFRKTEPVCNADEAVSNISLTLNYDSLSDVDFIIENVVEDLLVKQSAYRQLDKVCKRECLFLADTSCISITKLAGFTQRPEKVIGTHFMNPVPMTKAVELIRGYHTSDDTIQTVIQLMNTLNKKHILVQDFPGFVSNRISHLFMNEAAFVLQDQVAEPIDIDNIFKDCYGHKMGPLETADLIGLDTVVNSLDVLYQSFQDPKFKCCPLLRKMVDAGLLGRKSGQGFYKY